MYVCLDIYCVYIYIYVYIAYGGHLCNNILTSKDWDLGPWTTCMIWRDLEPFRCSLMKGSVVVLIGFIRLNFCQDEVTNVTIYVSQEHI